MRGADRGPGGGGRRGKSDSEIVSNLNINMSQSSAQCLGDHCAVDLAELNVDTNQTSRPAPRRGGGGGGGWVRG